MLYQCSKAICACLAIDPSEDAGAGRPGNSSITANLSHNSSFTIPLSACQQRMELSLIWHQTGLPNVSCLGDTKKWPCRNEPGKKKHPEFSSLPVCRECFDLLGAAAWHLEGDWKDEGGHDKYCRCCAGSAPGGTSTLMHCAKEGCKKGFCTG